MSKKVATKNRRIEGITYVEFNYSWNQKRNSLCELYSKGKLFERENQDTEIHMIKIRYKQGKRYR